MNHYTVEPLYVKSGDEIIAADFYRPKNIPRPAVIIMANTLGALRQHGLVRFAQQYAGAGYAVVLFDYRYWGGSTGRPRELVEVPKQLEDWRAVVTHISERPSIDQNRIVLWGFGLGAGYALDVATELRFVAAVMAHMPFLDGQEMTKQHSLVHLTQLAKLSSQDYMGAKVALSPVLVPVRSRNAFAVYGSNALYEGWNLILKPDLYWSGQIPARVFFHLVRYRPIERLKQINVPVFFLAAKHDDWIPIELCRQAVTDMALYTEYLEWETQHFDLFQPQRFDCLIQKHLEFLSHTVGAN